MPLETTFLNVRLPHPVMPGGGVCRTLEDVSKFASAEMPVINVSLVFDERAGNPGDVYRRFPAYSINALGLPSRGMNYYREVLVEMVHIAHAAGKKIMTNISAFSAEQYASLYQLCCEAEVDYVEFNFGCPNVKDGGVRKPIFSFYPELMRESLVQSGHRGEGPESGIKFSPMSNPVQRDETCHFITDLTKDNDAVQPRFATMCNTFPDTVVLLPDGRPAITITYGGMGGPAMKPIALGHISQFRKNQQEGNLPDYIEFVGSGGAETGQDVLDYTRVGASLVQATTPAADNGDDPGVYGEIAAQYAGLLENQED